MLGGTFIYFCAYSHICKNVHKHKNTQEEVKQMGWRRRAYYNSYPGRGPYSHLPPWERPGWAYGGRGYGRRWNADPRTCARFPWLPRWWWADPAYEYQPPTATPHDEIAALEDCKKELGEEKASIEQEIGSIETQLTALKSKLDAEKKQATEQ